LPEAHGKGEFHEDCDYLQFICPESDRLRTTSGSYQVSAVTNDGVPVSMIFNVQGSHIYSARNALCSEYRGATVSIVDVGTGKDLSGESPYK
jgi:hypothetical protein